MKRNLTFLFFSLVSLFCSVQNVMAQEIMPARLRVTTTPAVTLSQDYQQIGVGESFSLTIKPDTPLLLKASAPGYLSQYRTLRMEPGERKHEIFQLERESIPVLIRTNAPATVLCDGAELGVTPLSTFFVEPRAYRIVLRAVGFQEHTVELNLREGKPRVLDVPLTSDSGTFEVVTNPSGAHVIVNGIDRGVTPCTLERMREGEFKLSLRLTGYKPFTQTLAVTAGERIPLSISLEPLPAGLTVTTLPTSARVYINGTYRGDSDLTLSDLSPAAYTVRVEKVGYAPMTRTIALKSGDAQVEEFRLNAVRGTLSVCTQPASVHVWSEGKKLFTTAPAKVGAFTSARLAVEMIPGTYTLSFKADGYTETERVVTIQPNAQVVLNVKLVFHPNFEVETSAGFYRGVLIKQNATTGDITLETKPGLVRTFTREEIHQARFIQ